jgi:hypothetical protein
MPKKMPADLNHDQIRENFVQGTMVYRWKHFLLRCAIDCDGNDRNKRTWPFVYGMDEWQWVNAAMFDVADTTKAPILVAAWVFSPGGDETNLLHLPNYASEVFGFVELAVDKKAFPMDSCCEPWDVFSCSSGDCEVDSFQCPALEGFANVAALERESSFKNEALSSHRASQRKFYEEVEGEEDDEDD